MKITEINIKSFGKLHGVKITPLDGVNIIYGENESGKSTIMAFILSMLYGIGRGDQRSRYDPWTGGKITGLLAFEHDGKAYRLSRQFGVSRSSDRTQLFCETSGEEITLPAKAEPGEYVLGINRETFENSVFIGQAGTAIHGDNNEILAKLTNLAASGDESASKGEICERLNEASATLRSRRTNAIIPALEKQRSELLEERAVIVNRTSEADNLRDDITRLSHRRETLESELGTMQSEDTLSEKLRKLASLEDIMKKKTSADEAKQKYERLHNAMFGEKGGLDSDFLEDARCLLEGYNGQQVAISVKQEQLAAVSKKLENIDRSPLAKRKIVRKHHESMSNALEDYHELKQQRDELERQLENEPVRTPVSPGNTISAIIVGAALTLICVMLGIGISPIWFLIAAIVVLVVGAYVYFANRGFSLDVLPKDNIQLQNISSEMREINRKMRPILDEMDVTSMDELEDELYSIDNVNNRVSELQHEMESIQTEIDELREELAQILQQLKEKLYPYKNVSSDKEAVKIISTLGKMQCEHAALEARYQAEDAAFITALGDQEYDMVCIEAEYLREELGSSASRSVSSFDSDLDEKISTHRSELETVKTELARKETELGLMNSDPQTLSRLTDEIKLVTSRIDRYEFEYNAIQQAISALNTAFDSMQKDFGPIINFRASRIVESLTGARYGSVLISESLVPSVAEPGDGSIRSVSSLSAGTVDQIYLALRLAISGILSEENLPLLLDDAFAQYDDRRMADALKYIVEECAAGRLGQIIMFTCHDRMIYAAKECGLTKGILRLK